jgi:ankyrin repeat protein
MNGASGLNGDMETDEDAVERKKILNLVYANDYKGLKDLKVTTKNLNWREPHFKTDLDDRITPLACAAFLGRLKIAELLLENALVDLDLCTEEHEYTPLSAACMAGNYEIVKLLAEGGAQVNHRNSQGFTPMLYAFSRMTETTNIYENKNICLKIAEVLL